VVWWSEFLAIERRLIVFPARYELNLCYVEESRPPLWSSGENSWLHIQRSGFHSRRYQIFWEVVSLERGPLSLVSTTDELLGRKSSGSCLETREYGRRNSSLWPRDILWRQKLALTSPISGCLSVGIVRSRTEATEFSSFSQKQHQSHVKHVMNAYIKQCGGNLPSTVSTEMVITP
jgi:hypothetical protein